MSENNYPLLTPNTSIEVSWGNVYEILHPYCYLLAYTIRFLFTREWRKF